MLLNGCKGRVNGLNDDDFFQLRQKLVETLAGQIVHYAVIGHHVDTVGGNQHCQESIEAVSKLQALRGWILGR